MPLWQKLLDIRSKMLKLNFKLRCDLPNLWFCPRCMKHDPPAEEELAAAIALKEEAEVKQEEQFVVRGNLWTVVSNIYFIDPRNLEPIQAGAETSTGG